MAGGVNGVILHNDYKISLIFTKVSLKLALLNELLFILLLLLLLYPIFPLLGPEIEELCSILIIKQYLA